MSDHIVLIDFYTLVLLLLVILILLIIIYKMKRIHNTCEFLLAKFYMDTVKTMMDFSEDDVETWLNTFSFTRDLNGDKERIWELDYDVFSLKCIEGLSILAFYMNKNSIYYRDESIFRKLKYLCRLLFVRIQERLKFYENEQTYSIFTAFLMCMYLCSDKENTAKNDILIENFAAHMKGYNFYEFKTRLVDLTDYHQFTRLSSSFVHNLNYVNGKFKV